jgi:hypothetical protein
MSKIYVIVREREEASDLQVVDVLQTNRAFTKRSAAAAVAKQLQDEAIQLADTVSGEDPKTIKHCVVPLTVE